MQPRLHQRERKLSLSVILSEGSNLSFHVTIAAQQRFFGLRPQNDIALGIFAAMTKVGFIMVVVHVREQDMGTVPN